MAIPHCHKRGPPLPRSIMSLLLHLLVVAGILTLPVQCFGPPQRKNSKPATPRPPQYPPPLDAATLASPGAVSTEQDKDDIDDGASSPSSSSFSLYGPPTKKKDSTTVRDKKEEKETDNKSASSSSMPFSLYGPPSSASSSTKDSSTKDETTKSTTSTSANADSSSGAFSLYGPPAASSSLGSSSSSNDNTKSMDNSFGSFSTGADEAKVDPNPTFDMNFGTTSSSSSSSSYMDTGTPSTSISSNGSFQAQPDPSSYYGAPAASSYSPPPLETQEPSSSSFSSAWTPPPPPPASSTNTYDPAAAWETTSPPVPPQQQQQMYMPPAPQMPNSYSQSYSNNNAHTNQGLYHMNPDEGLSKMEAKHDPYHYSPDHKHHVKHGSQHPGAAGPGAVWVLKADHQGIHQDQKSKGSAATSSPASIYKMGQEFSSQVLGPNGILHLRPDLNDLKP